MKILAIETSCDETAISLLEAVEGDSGVDFTVLRDVVHSQISIHQPYGGVFPALAKREHIKNLPIVLNQVMQGQNDQENSEIKPDVICVTSGPGLEPALWTGIVFAKELGEKWGVPVIPVNHMEGHILSVLVPNENSMGEENFQLATNKNHKNPDEEIPAQKKFSFNISDLKFPALALLISGGHTELVLVKDIGDYSIIGKTRDDAVGEAFDKVARILGLPYPGGPEISKLAAEYNSALSLSGTKNLAPTPVSAPKFTRPMLHTKDYDFSFSGLKTAVLYFTQSLPQPLSDEMKIAIAYEFEQTVTDVIVHKTKKALEEFGIQTLIVGGGVAANATIKRGLQEMISTEFPDTKFLTPTKELSTDNSLMIAIAGYFKIKKGQEKSPNFTAIIGGEIRAEGNLSL